MIRYEEIQSEYARAVEKYRSDHTRAAAALADLVRQLEIQCPDDCTRFVDEEGRAITGIHPLRHDGGSRWHTIIAVGLGSPPAVKHQAAVRVVIEIAHEKVNLNVPGCDSRRVGDRPPADVVAGEMLYLIRCKIANMSIINPEVGGVIKVNY